MFVLTAMKSVLFAQKNVYVMQDYVFPHGSDARPAMKSLMSS